MGKTIIINEKQAKSMLLKESILLDTLPNDIKTTLKKNETSLGLNPVFPEEYGESFDSKITAKRFEETKEKLIKIGVIEECDDLANAIPHLINRCQKLEEPIKQNLEKIAYNYIVSLFNLPEDTVDFSISLVGDISDIQMGVNVQSEDVNYEFDDINHKKSLNGEIKKRRVLNALMTGAALRFASNIKTYVADIYDLEPKLVDLYRKIMALNDYILFTNDEENITDEKRNQLGFSNIILGGKQTKSSLTIEATIFPILIYEEVRAFLELAAAHGLPKSKEEANYVMKKADYLQAEPWDMRLGPALWDLLMNCCGDIETEMIPYLFMKIAKLPVNKFNYLMREVFAGTKKGKRIISNMISKIQFNNEYDDFTNRLQMKNADISMINDEYIKAEEL